MQAIAGAALVAVLTWTVVRWRSPTSNAPFIDRVLMALVAMSAGLQLYTLWPSATWVAGGWAATVASAALALLGLVLSAMGWQGAQRAVGIERTAADCASAVFTGRALGLGLPSTLGLDLWTLADSLAAGGKRALLAKPLEKLFGVAAAAFIWPVALWLAQDSLAQHPQLETLTSAVRGLAMGALAVTVAAMAGAAWLAGRRGVVGIAQLVGFKAMSHGVAAGAVWVRVQMLSDSPTELVDAAGTMLSMVAAPLQLQAGPSLTAALTLAEHGQVQAAAFVGVEMWALPGAVLLAHRLATWPQVARAKA